MQYRTETHALDEKDLMLASSRGVRIAAPEKWTAEGPHVTNDCRQEAMALPPIGELYEATVEIRRVARSQGPWGLRARRQRPTGPCDSSPGRDLDNRAAAR